MSQKADEVIDEILGRENGSLDWGTAQRILVNELGVMTQTARKYIRESEVADIITDEHGNQQIVKSVDASGETVLSPDIENVLEMKVGDRTDDMYANLHKLEPIAHPWIPRGHESGYIRRRVTESKTDVAVVTATMADEDYSTLLIGKHGIGKDKLVMHICAITNRPVVRPTFSSNSGDLIDLLIGHYTPDDDGTFTFRKGLLTVSIENGYTFVADEINMIGGRLQTQLNDILEDADQRSMTIPETNEVIDIHPEFRFVGTMNPPTMNYGGTEELNDSFASRFFPVKLPPLEPSAEKEVVAGNTHWNANSSDLNRLIGSNGIITKLRNLHDSGNIDTWISTREVIKIGRMTDKLGSLEDATTLILTGVVHPADEDAVETAIDDLK